MTETYQDLPLELFEPAQVDEKEKEHIAQPAMSALQDGWIRMRKNKGSVVSLVILIIIVLLAIFGPILSSYDYAKTNYTVTFQAPTREHIFGTDQFGRDQFARIWYGTRISLLIAFFAACIDIFIGVTYGAVSALAGGRVDAVMQRIIEILVGIPSLIIIILLMMVMPAGITSIIIALAITGWVNMARLVRAQILKLKEQEFVLAARILGTSPRNIILKHLIPNTVGVIVINAMFTIPSAIFTEAFLSFIGIGLSEPKASLGVLINNGYQVLHNFPYLLIFPAIVIILIMVCFSILGDGLRDALDPRMRK